MKQSPTAEQAGAVVERLVKQVAMDTMIQNAIRDDAVWAWVPKGNDTCAFCITLASRGWQPASKAQIMGGHASHIHTNCNCQFVISFKGGLDIEGYNPQFYEDMYYDADGAFPEEKINYLRKQHYAANRDKINAQKRANYAKTHKPKVRKKLTIEDFETANHDGIIKKEVVEIIYSILESKKAKNAFESVTIKSLDKGTVFDTVYIQNGVWYDSHLCINADWFAGKSIDDINKSIKLATNTVCESIDDAITHELYHVEMANRYNISVINLLDQTDGIREVSNTAEKDMLETISEIGVKKDRDGYDTLSTIEREILDKYLGE